MGQFVRSKTFENRASKADAGRGRSRQGQQLRLSGEEANLPRGTFLMQRGGVLIELVAPLHEVTMHAVDLRLGEIPVAHKCFVQRFGHLAFRGNAAVKVQYKIAESNMVQAPQDSVDRGALLCHMVVSR